MNGGTCYNCKAEPSDFLTETVRQHSRKMCAGEGYCRKFGLERYKCWLVDIYYLFIISDCTLSAHKKKNSIKQKTIDLFLETHT